MWVEPTKHSKYRDPYWFMLAPMKRIQHYFFLSSTANFLFSQGLNNKAIVN